MQRAIGDIGDAAEATMSWASSSSGWSSFSEERIREIVVEAGDGATIVDLAARHQVPEFVIRGWQSRYGVLPDAGPSGPLPALPPGLGGQRPRGASDRAEDDRLRRLEQENSRLRRILADLSLENRALKERLSASN